MATFKILMLNIWALLMFIIWALAVVMVVVIIIKDCKAIRCMKDRRKLLDEVCDYLHDVAAVSGRNLEGHMEFMQKFRRKFEKDRF